MLQNRNNVHEYHFVLAAAMRKELDTLRLYGRTWCRSRLIVEIISLMDAVLEEKHFSQEQYASKYEQVDMDPSIVRQPVHVYLPRRIYRRLKLIHQDLDFYSIAQLMRLIQAFAGNY